MNKIVQPQWLEWAKELQFIAQGGLTYSKDVFDIVNVCIVILICKGNVLFLNNDTKHVLLYGFTFILTISLIDSFG
jgi:hypothetical protein